MRARFVRLAELIEQIGFEALPRQRQAPRSKAAGAAHHRTRRHFPRHLCHSGRPVVLVRAFIKKTQKTPPRELAIARERAKAVK
ncbi:type II toxin-antitoxin system RelE/ParE family toxin [Rhodopseudomonas palustris]|uniref:type II toxin-antitoxin system RelE/ParE family toxin n=1 Tax=Rhodopseudomonas palustris TaxID=1076 RepID=UPI003D9AD812